MNFEFTAQFFLFHISTFSNIKMWCMALFCSPLVSGCFFDGPLQLIYALDLLHRQLLTVSLGHIGGYSSARCICLLCCNNADQYVKRKGFMPLQDTKSTLSI